MKRPDHVARMYGGARRIAPGLYELADGSALINATEILAEVGLPDTAENREVVSVAARSWCQENGVKAVEL